jgi:RNA polymerase sigma-70 factor (ECF subfamily)
MLRLALTDTGNIEPRARSLEDEVVSLFDELRVPVIRYLTWSRVSVVDAEEIVQEVFLLLFQRLQTGQKSENPAGWVFRAAHNHLLKHRDRQRREAEILSAAPGEADGLADGAAGTDATIEATERRRRLLAVVRALPEQDQECLHLRAEGLKYREIADVLGISLGAVANSLQRAIARIVRADEGGRYGIVRKR